MNNFEELKKAALAVLELNDVKGCWQSSLLETKDRGAVHAIVTEHGDNVCEATGDTVIDSVIIDYIESVSPTATLALIAQLEAAQKLNPLSVNVSELEATYIGDIRLHMAAISNWKLRAETAEAALSAANERLLVPGVLRCAKCSFQLAKTNLYMASGTTGPGDNKTEPCPNGCGPLWPVTWEQWSREIGVQLDRYFDEAKELREKLANPVVLNTSDVMSRNYVTKAIKAAGGKVEGE